MPTKLADLRIKKVDFVDAGANPGANVMLYKRADGASAAAETNTESAAEQSAVARIFNAIGKALGLSIDSVVNPVVKSAQTFGEAVDLNNRYQISNEVWDICYALRSSIDSILWDDDKLSTQKAALMSQSVDEFSAVIKEIIPIWAANKVYAKVTKSVQDMSPERLETLKADRDALNALIEKASPAGETNPTDPPPADEAVNKNQPIAEGEHEMKIDKSKLTPEQLAALEDIEKSAGIPDEATPPPAAAPAAAEAVAGTESVTDGDGDIYKGLNPVVAAELKSLRKAADDAADRELLAVAKKYEIIGKKPEELAPILKSLKAAGGDAYASMIAVLDATVETVEKSGTFNEIGKRGNGTNDAWTAIEKHADALIAADPKLTRPEAVDKACLQHPELVHEYENSK